MKKNLLALAAIGALYGVPLAQAADAQAANFLYDTSTKNKTIWPKPVTNSGVVKYNEHRQDLSRWPSLSYQDHRSAKKPETVSLQGALNGNADNGKKLAMNNQKGNCWACHALPGDPQPGSGGPALLNSGTWRYSDANMYQQVWDRRVANPATVMPPFGTNGALSDQEIRDIVAYLQSLK